MVKITIDYSKCSGPKDCGICIRTCPQAVFLNAPIGKFNPNKRPDNHQVLPFFVNTCTSCKICENKCPEKCITVY